jgi:hypothetical protein
MANLREKMNNIEYIFSLQPVFEIIVPILGIVSLTRLMISSKFFRDLIWSIIEKDIKVEGEDGRIMIEYKDWMRVFENKIVFLSDNRYNFYEVTYETREKKLIKRENESDQNSFDLISLPNLSWFQSKRKDIKVFIKVIDKTSHFIIPKIKLETTLRHNQKYDWKLNAICTTYESEIIFFRRNDGVFMIKGDKLTIVLFDNKVLSVTANNEYHFFGIGRNVYDHENINFILIRYKIANLFFWVDLDLYLEPGMIA